MAAPTGDEECEALLSHFFDNLATFIPVCQVTHSTGDYHEVDDALTQLC